MLRARSSTAEKIVYAALDTLANALAVMPVQSFHDALDNVKPSVEVRSRRVGGATYQVPVEVRTDRRQALAIRWVIETARARSENTMTDRLSKANLLDAANNRGDGGKET